VTETKTTEIKSRIQHKRDTDINWQSQNPKLLNGEIVIVDADDGGIFQKIGDGIHKYSELPAIESCRPSKTINAILAAGAWANGQQAISVSGLNANQNGIISLPQTFSAAQYDTASAAEMYLSAQTEGSITVSCNGDTPNIDIPVIIVLLG